MRKLTVTEVDWLLARESDSALRLTYLALRETAAKLEHLTQPAVAKRLGQEAARLRASWSGAQEALWDEIAVLKALRSPDDIHNPRYGAGVRS